MSCDEFPMHFVVVQNDAISKLSGGRLNPLGHIMASRVAGSPDMIYIEQFIIKQTL